VIPLHLKLRGFLSYREPVEVDFSGFDLACISGQNGAGKSSLLDGITWVLFGQARKRDESVINNQSEVAEVTFTFEYENNRFRVIRSMARGKTTILEFQISDGGVWRTITEHSTRETQARIEKVLRLDYDTFINVSFFLQGRADQFAQQPPSRRKDILGSILGLEIWEEFKERTSERRKVVEGNLGEVDGRITEIDTELSEEEPRKAQLADLELQISGLIASRKLQEAALASIKQMRSELDKQKDIAQRLSDGFERDLAKRSGLQTRLAGREAERQPHVIILERAGDVETAYTAWQKARRELEKWDGTAAQFHEQEKLRLPFLNEINTQKAKLEQEKETLERQGDVIKNQSSLIEGMEIDLEAARNGITSLEMRAEERLSLEKQIQFRRERQVELRTENASLKIEMEELKQRIGKLEAADGATCPLCGQVLSKEHRLSTLERLQTEGSQKGDNWRANKLATEELATQLIDHETIISRYENLDSERVSLLNTVSQLAERLASNQKTTKDWEANGARRLVQVNKILATEKFSLPARRKLAKVDKELAVLGYETSAHDAARQSETRARHAEEDFRALETARAALKPLEDEITNLNLQISSLTNEITNQKAVHQAALEALSTLDARTPELDSAERNLFDIQERENQFNQEVGAARQKVTVLDELRKRKKKLEEERGELSLRIGRYKILERAFGKDGVPALLIEQALPEIELKANEILGRLSNDSMRLHFETQAKFKNEKRKDLRETLEIQVSDGAGERDYEMYSGGEAFRVNFAIRLALSEVLAKRKGARLQMLVIDEGFGSQDALGRQRLIQAINAVRADFAKILIITHLDELKDAFPTRIEVEKSETGSTVTVI
jgi:exonuclease SbcC